MHTDLARESEMIDDPVVHTLQRSLELAAEEPHRFDARDFECLEAFWAIFDADFTAAGFIIKLSDGRRFDLTYDFGDQAEGESESDVREVLRVRQMSSTKALPAGQPGWDVEVAAINVLMWETPLPLDVTSAERLSVH
jgi:hypothetical protein